MKYYSEDNTEIIINNDILNRINRGSGGAIYRLNDIECVKLYYLDTPFKIEKEIFDTMKELDLDNFCKLYNMVFNNKKELVGYTMKYYDTINENILLMGKDYLLDNFNSLYNSFIKLSDNRILANDLWIKNCLIGKNITVIDFDYYLKSDLSIEEIKEIDISRLLLLFNKIICYYYELLYGEVPDNISYILDDIFSYSTNPPKRLNKIFSKRKIIDTIKK